MYIENKIYKQESKQASKQVNKQATIQPGGGVEHEHDQSEHQHPFLSGSEAKRREAKGKYFHFLSEASVRLSIHSSYPVIPSYHILNQ